MSGFYLFSPEPSEIYSNEDTPTELPRSPTRSQTFSPQSIQNHSHKEALVKRKGNPKKAHPNYADMVDEAIYNKGIFGKGSSLFAVKKFLQEKYDLNMKYAVRRIKLVITDALEKGRYVKTTGHGFVGRFRLSNNTRRNLNNKYGGRRPKLPKITFKNTQASKKTRHASPKNPKKGVKLNSDQKNRELLKNIRKRKAAPEEPLEPRAEEIKKARTGGPAIMRALEKYIKVTDSSTASSTF